MKNNSLLLVVDVQNGFVVNDQTLAIIPRINNMIEVFGGDNVIASRFINPEKGPWERFLGWTKMKSSPEIDLHPNLKINKAKVFNKSIYSAWDKRIEKLCRKQQIDTVFLCGIDTDQCVLSSAIDIFSVDIKPVVITDCCASSAGQSFHIAGIKLLERLIGKAQMIESKDL